MSLKPSERALKAQRQLGGKLGEILIKLGLLSDEDRAKALAEQLGLALAKPDDFPRDDIHLVFLPRYPWQAEQLADWDWRCPVFVPRQPIPPVPLLKGSDLVISSGGTMLREAAFLGVPSYGIFQSAIGEVDKALSASGQLILISGPDDFDKFRFTRKTVAGPTSAAADTMDRLLAQIMSRAGVNQPEDDS